jgi:hypothetical protein
VGRPGGYLQHYFDSRGVVRLYEMSFDGRTWNLTRRAADSSPLDFAQQITGSLSNDGNTIDGRWETSADGEEWKVDPADVSQSPVPPVRPAVRRPTTRG